jgi:hypothetical protein
MDSMISNVQRTILILVAIILCLILLAVFWVPAPGPGLPIETVWGWIFMKPIVSSISYQGENFTTKFTNSLSVPITIENSPPNNIPAFESITNGDQNCTNVLVNGKTGKSLIESRGEFTISATCPHKVDGEYFDVIIVIPYNATFNGVISSHNESGHIKGFVDDS